MEQEPQSHLPRSGIEAHGSGLRRKLLIAACAVLVGAGVLLTGYIMVMVHHSQSKPVAAVAANSGGNSLTQEQTAADQFMTNAGNSLINMHDQVGGGWRFKSAIQAPHYQTDRDVGAASVGMGFLAAADKDPKNGAWLQSAEKTASWLTSVAQSDGKGGTYWTDYVDDGDKSTDVYTSFDDGTIGISDFYWQLYQKTQNPQYKATALSGLQWTFSQASNIGTASQPVYSWPWEANNASSEHYMGMGEGAVGITYAFASYYERLKVSDPAVAAQCQQYIDGTLRYINQTRTTLGNNGGDSRALPETGIVGQDGDTTMNSGYLSGAAGAAYMYLKLYKVFNDPQYLAQAKNIFSWLEDTKNGPMVTPTSDSVAWKLSLDPEGGNNTVLATGFEEGSAGIGWTYLQAYKVTGDKHYLDIAQKAANWLDTVSVKSATGISWHEDESPANPVIHANLNNGTAGDIVFLQDLANVTTGQLQTKYQQMADQGLSWIIGSAKGSGSNLYWNDNGGGGASDNYSRDPSMHWGTAGLVTAAARMAGGSIDTGGEELGL